MTHAPTSPLPIPRCPDCNVPQRGRDAVCTCGYKWCADPLTLDPFTRALGLREVRKAKRQLAIARAIREVERVA